MRVSVLGFGSVWRRRLGKDPGDPKRFARWRLTTTRPALRSAES